ncbi:DUF6491 family protein [Pseudoxanthomonas sp. UTMC 1351]|uniref:DUF6491 family protein n=1 Tax=Pseudoxanthomonas sp. UTMC 1351 TaxID=2695853 RepID=UPI0034CDC641
MKRLMMLCLMTVMGAGALSACSSLPNQAEAERLELYRSHAGEPVPSFHYFGTLNGWTPLSDSALTVWTRPNQAYLLELSGPCQDLEYAIAIGVTNTMGRVYSRFDDVIVRGGGGVSGNRFPCRILSIRPLDVKALKATQKEMREAALVEREAGKQ